MPSEKPKRKKEKIVYIDDGRTISDMSGTSGGLFRAPRKTKKEKPVPLAQTPWQTYWGAVKMMLVPMFVVIGIITFIFLLMYFSMR